MRMLWLGCGAAAVIFVGVECGSAAIHMVQSGVAAAADHLRPMPDNGYKAAEARIDKVFVGSGYTVVHNEDAYVTYVLALDSDRAKALADPLTPLSWINGFTVESYDHTSNGNLPNCLLGSTPIRVNAPQVACVIVNPDCAPLDAILNDFNLKQVDMSYMSAPSVLYIAPNRAAHLRRLLYRARIKNLVNAVTTSDAASVQQFKFYLPLGRRISVVDGVLNQE